MSERRVWVDAGVYKWVLSDQNGGGGGSTTEEKKAACEIGAPFRLKKKKYTKWGTFE